MNKYVRVMDGLKSNASGEKFELDKVITAKTWNSKEIEPEKMGGFNFSTEDKILRYIFRGDTIYDVIIPEDAEVVNVDNEKGIFRANKIIVTNPRKITEDMVIDIYKKSTLPKFVYMKSIIPTTQSVYDWFMLGSTDVSSDEQLINNFRDAMINYNN